MNLRLLRAFLEAYPFQPATAVWRAAEVHALAELPFPEGLGLDLGCGDGRLTKILRSEVGELRLVGLDVDPHETELARTTECYERVHTTTAVTIPESDETFDFAFSVSVMEHIRDLEVVLSEVGRVLKPGGLLITTVPSVGFHQCLWGPIWPWSSRPRYLRSVDRRVAHLRYWTSEEWRQALAVAGMRLQMARPIISCAEIRRWELLARMTSGVLHILTRGRAPIEIQRSLGMRRATQRLPRPVAGVLARVLGAGLSAAMPTDEGSSGCLLVVASRDRDGRRL